MYYLENDTIRLNSGKVIRYCGIQVMEKLVDIVLFLNREIHHVFGSAGMY